MGSLGTQTAKEKETMWPFSSKPRRSPLCARPFRPHLEALEGRCVPSSAGYLDTSFGAPNGYVLTNINSSYSSGNGIAIQTDGKVVVAGGAQSGRGNSLTVLRYNSDGSLDSTFGNGGIVLTTVVKGMNQGTLGYQAVGIQSDGKILVSGNVHLSGTTPRTIVVARYYGASTAAAALIRSSRTAFEGPVNGPNEASQLILLCL
jgi:uncharacterized delta-60 repeat protein